MERLELFETPLAGHNLIEASAGTGKTYTIVALYLRAIVELGLSVEEILVVTFTNAATAELKGRIREKLVALVRSLENGVPRDDFCNGFLQHLEQPDRALKRLRLALLSFDRAAIFTIHGFCQRALADSAFESGMPFQTEMLVSERELLQEIVDDYWRRFIQDETPGLVRFLVDAKITPDRLLAGLKGSINKPYLKVRGVPMPGDPLEMEIEYEHALQQAREAWSAHGEEISRLIQDSTALSKTRYPLASRSRWLLHMEALMSSSSGSWFDEFEKFTTSVLEVSVNKGQVAPAHPFFDRCDRLLQARGNLDGFYRQAWVAHLEALIGYVNRELQERKRRLRVQSYDDLLLNLDAALRGPSGEALSSSLRGRYRAALIDEFQDTDPLQYGIFRSIFTKEVPLFLVGDPKQAIYSFRGADIFAYLRARDAADSRYTLDVNWRSDPRLINAVNTLFTQPHEGFLYRRIPFHPAEAADRSREALTEEGDVDAPFRVGLVQEKMNKEQAVALCADWTAAEIARLLALAGEGSLKLGDRSLTSGDIAVLVRTHSQGLMVRKALAGHGIHSVQRSQEGVFHSFEAIELLRVLSAVAEPADMEKIRSALSTDMLGLSGNDIDSMARDEALLDSYITGFREYHRIWSEHGFMRMFRHLLREQGVMVRLLGMDGGERRLTNLLHMGELLHGQERRESPGIGGLIKWLVGNQQSESSEDDAHQLRLESDERLVQIVTVHKSKGLQYPVVFCPYVWDAGMRQVSSGEPYRFHDPDLSDEPVLELGSESWAETRECALKEEMAESLRLLYVALTRAEHRCYMLWGDMYGAGKSPMAWLLHPPGDPQAPGALERMEKEFKKLKPEELRRRLERLVEVADGDVCLFDCETPTEIAPLHSWPGSDRPLSLEPALFDRRLVHDSRVGSFSGLISHRHSVESPDHDAGSTRPIPEGEGHSGGRDIFSFPRGANPGSCLHGIFEELMLDRRSRAECDALVRRQLELYAIDREWTPVVVEMVSRVLDTELEAGSGLRLVDISPEQCLVEMEFYYPVSSLDAASLAVLLRKHGFSDTPELQSALERLSFADLRGYLKGFIDLVFEQDGKFYLLDYKSNWLGSDKGDYDQARLRRAIAEEGYFLQYLLYTVALHRYLGQRIPDYRYEHHFGAVFYLFLRGMDPADGPVYGVFRDRPSLALVNALDSYFSGLEAVS